MSLARSIKINTNDADVHEQLLRIVTRISSILPNSVIRAFGSLARGELTVESDLDISVIVPDDIDTQELRKKIRTGCILSHPWPLDLIFFNVSHYENRSKIGGVCFDIAEEGIELYPVWKLQ